MRRRRASKGVYCIEGDWWGKPHRQSSVQPMLELLSKWDTCPVQFVCRDVATSAEFKYYLKQCTQRNYARFPIIYFAFHGTKGKLHIGDRRTPGNTIDIQDIADALENRCTGKVLYFGSCETVNIHGNELNHILNRTGAKAVCGYRGSVDWLESTVFDALLELAHLRWTPTIDRLRPVVRRSIGWSKGSASGCTATSSGGAPWRWC